MTKDTRKIEWQKKYNQTKKGKEVRAKGDKKYAQTVKGKITQAKSSKKYQQSKKGKETTAKTKQKYKHSVKGKTTIQNQNFINNKIKSGKLVKTNVCVDCGKGNTQFHHEKYHNPPKLIDIVEVCKNCHVKRDDKADRRKKK
jgi:phosphate starvation-inducible protein PhoH